MYLCKFLENISLQVQKYGTFCPLCALLVYILVGAVLFRKKVSSEKLVFCVCVC